VIATEEQQALLTALGADIVAIMRERLIDMPDAPGSHAYAREFGRLLLHCVLLAGDPRELNRVSILEGAATAIGEAVGQQKSGDADYIKFRVEEGMARGVETARRELRARGSA
jgi:hypothetical protein